MRFLISTAVCVLLFMPSTGCAPVFGDARLLEPGGIEITPSASGSAFVDTGDAEYLVNTFAAQGQVGVHERLNLGAAYARFEDTEFAHGFNSAAFGARIGVVPDRVAVAVPFIFAFGEGIETGDSWAVHPTALFTLPIGPRVDFNPSVGLLVPFCSGCDASDFLVKVNAGFGFHLPLAMSPTLRPETGILINPGESGVIWVFGAGVSLRN